MTERTDPLDLDAIEARLAAATPGPWKIHLSDEDEDAGNAALIAHAPADLARLVAEVRRLRRLREWDAERAAERAERLSRMFLKSGINWKERAERAEAEVRRLRERAEKAEAEAAAIRDVLERIREIVRTG